MATGGPIPKQGQNGGQGQQGQQQATPGHEGTDGVKADWKQQRDQQKAQGQQGQQGQQGGGQYMGEGVGENVVLEREKAILYGGWLYGLASRIEHQEDVFEEDLDEIRKIATDLLPDDYGTPIGTRAAQKFS